MSIEKAGPADFKAIYAIYCHYVKHSSALLDLEPESWDAYEKKLEGLLKDPFYVARWNGQLIGYGYAHPAFDKAGYAGIVELSIYFAPGAHHGLALPLFEAIKESCIRRGDRMIISRITGSNEASLAFHKKLGFQQYGSLPKAGMKFDQLFDVHFLYLPLK